MDFSLSAFLGDLSLILLFIGVILIAKVLNDFFTPYSLDNELFCRDNLALAVSFCGYLGGVSIVFVGALMGPSKGILMDLVYVGGYTLSGVVLLNLCLIINDKCILYRFSNTKEIITDRNVGTGAAQMGSYIATGLILAGSIYGEGGGPETMLTFFVLGQGVLILFSWVYSRLLPYNLQDEIEKDNATAGISFSGALIAVGIVLMHANAGNFTSWTKDLTTFFLEALIIFIFLPLFRFCFDRLIIARFDLSHEIVKDRNTGAAFVEAIVLISFAAVLFFVLS